MTQLPSARAPRAVVIGSSAGAVAALNAIIPAIRKNFPLPVLIVVHIPPDRRSAIAELLGDNSQLTVCEAEDKEMLVGGNVYLAPPDYHLLVEKNGQISLSYDEPENFSRPSIDVLFETAAEAFGGALIGIILTGANTDGAAGLRAIARAGGQVIVQEPEEAESSEMPRAALALCPEARRMRVCEIVEYLNSITEGKYESRITSGR